MEKFASLLGSTPTEGNPYLDVVGDRITLSYW